MRITTKREGSREKVLYLEGKICQDWVKELHAEIEKGMNAGEKVILDFSKVGYIDEEGAKMLCSLPPKKVKKRNLSLFIKELLRMEAEG